MIIFDTETTGLIKNGLIELSKQPQIIEFAAIKLNDQTLEEVDRIEFLVNPKKKLPEIITKITGLRDADLIEQKTFDYHFPSLVKFFFGEKISFAHNHSFDTGMLSLELRRLKKQYAFPWPIRQICTVVSSYHLKNYRLNLQRLHFELFNKEFEEAHRAMKDVEALTRCVKELIKREVIKL